MLEQLEAVVQGHLADLDGVLALRQTRANVAPHLFCPGEDLSGLAIEPRYQMAGIVDLILDAHPEARLGVVARGCDERALIELAKRNQVNLDQVTVIGIACTAEEAVMCRCYLPYPQNLEVGERVQGAVDTLIEEYEAMSREERLAFWRRQFDKCIKCYGCRNACPECFCEHCALEEEIWVPRGKLPLPFVGFHLIRAMHTIGRCVGCGECEAACPAHIPLTVLYSLLRRDVRQMFGYEAGLSPDDAPPLSVMLDESLPMPR